MSAIAGRGIHSKFSFASKSKKKRPLNKKQRAQKRITPHQVIQSTHHELLLEIQYKYPGLYNISVKTNHKLLEEIARIIFHRVKDLMDVNPECRDNCFKLSSNYRKSHPHFEDYEMIISTLHALQDASGAPRLEITEKELLQPPTKPLAAHDIPFEKIKAVYMSYSEKVVKALSAHISQLDTSPAGDDGEELVARKKVREEIKKMLPYMPTVVKQVVSKHFTPQRKTPMHRIRIYGEPFLPSKDAMSPFVRRYHGGESRVIRHPRMYNLLLFKLPQHKYTQLMAMDGTTVTGAKLVIRSDIPVYCASDSLRSEMSCAVGGPSDARIVPFNDDIEEEIMNDE